MANYIYGLSRAKCIEAGIDLIGGDVKVLLGDSADYVASQNTDEFLDPDVTGAGIVATSGNLASKTNVLGTFDAADVTLSTVSGDQSEMLVGYIDTGVSTTSPLFWRMDTATGLPITPNGGNITIAWHSSGILTI